MTSKFGAHVSMTNLFVQNNEMNTSASISTNNLCREYVKTRSQIRRRNGQGKLKVQADSVDFVSSSVTVRFRVLWCLEREKDTLFCFIKKKRSSLSTSIPIGERES